VLSINEPGDICGSVAPDTIGSFQAFIGRGGAITSFGVPGATSTFANDIDNNKTLTVGYYSDAAAILHGFYRDHSGALHFPIDPPGSAATILFGVDNKNDVVGRYADVSGATHGLFFVPPDSFFTFDYPGSTFTSLNGINQQGFITGRYVDAAGIAHGFIARVRGTPSGNAMGKQATPSNLPSMAAPRNESASAWGGATPAR
jgi:uncharacterized membrane protein